MELRSIVRKAEQIQKDFPKPIREEHVFQLFFLKDDKDQNIQVVEVKEIDFAEVIQHLNQGKSIFIKRKRILDRNKNPRLSEDQREPWYFTHI